MVISRASRDVQEKFLLRNGADKVVYPEKQMAKWTALRCSASNILDFVELDNEHAMLEVPVPHDWIGKSIGQIDVRKKYNVNIIGLKKNGKLLFSITADQMLDAGDSLFALGKDKDLQKCFRL